MRIDIIRMMRMIIIRNTICILIKTYQNPYENLINNEKCINPTGENFIMILKSLIKSIRYSTQGYCKIFEGFIKCVLW